MPDKNRDSADRPLAESLQLLGDIHTRDLFILTDTLHRF